jgi:hypothetical protein
MAEDPIREATRAKDRIMFLKIISVSFREDWDLDLGISRRHPMDFINGQHSFFK